MSDKLKSAAAGVLGILALGGYLFLQLLILGGIITIALAVFRWVF